MALTNAEKQKRWRSRQNERAQVIAGTPKEIAENILRELGVDMAKKISRALDKRLSAIRKDCQHCAGTGFAPYKVSTECGMPIGDARLPCTCEVTP